MTTEDILDSINISIASYGFVICFFPIYNVMQSRYKPKVHWSVILALVFVWSTYTFISAMSISYFGEMYVQPSLFENIKTDTGIFSVILRAMFLFIFLCNIPFVFFPGKAAILGLLGEFLLPQPKENEVQDMVLKETDADDNFLAVGEQSQVSEKPELS